MQLDDHRPLLLRPGEGETVADRPERTLRILAELDDLIVTWFRYEPDEKGPDPHVHFHHTDAFYVLAGELELTLGAERKIVTASPGTFAAAPPHTIHTFRNSSSATAVFLNLHAPSLGFGDEIRGKKNPGFDQHEPPADGGRPFADAVLGSPDDAETLEREVSTHRILCDLPQLTAIDMTFRPAFEGVDPHTHADHVDAVLRARGRGRVPRRRRAARSRPRHLRRGSPGRGSWLQPRGAGADPSPQPACTTRRFRRPPAAERVT